MALDNITRFMYTAHNIAEASHLLLPLLSSRAPPFKKTLDWLQFSYTVNRTGFYVAPASTVPVPFVVSEGDPLFPVI